MMKSRSGTRNPVAEGDRSETKTSAGSRASVGSLSRLAVPTESQPTTALQISISKTGAVSVKRVEGSDLLSPRAGRAIQGEGAELVNALEWQLEKESAAVSQKGPAAVAVADEGDDDDDPEELTETAEKKRSRFAVLFRAIIALRTLAAYILAHPLFEVRHSAHLIWHAHYGLLSPRLLALQWCILFVILYSCCTLPLDSGDLAVCAKIPGPGGERCRATKLFLSWCDSLFRTNLTVQHCEFHCHVTSPPQVGL
jgi:hypothetical protein